MVPGCQEGLHGALESKEWASLNLLTVLAVLLYKNPTASACGSLPGLQGGVSGALMSPEPPAV